MLGWEMALMIVTQEVFRMKTEREIKTSEEGERQLTLLLVFTPLGQSDPWLTAGDQWTSWGEKNKQTNKP